MRMRRKKNLVPRMEACGQWLIRDPKAQRGHWRELMPGAKELRLELGCGKGRFTCQTAAADPDVLFIAVERVPDAMVMAMEKARSLALTNVFFVDADAAELPEFFAPDEVDLIYINFCDPWPPKRHAKRRLTHRDFLLRYRQVLRDGGEIHFKTDNVGRRSTGAWPSRPSCPRSLPRRSSPTGPKKTMQRTRRRDPCPRRSFLIWTGP